MQFPLISVQFFTGCKSMAISFPMSKINNVKILGVEFKILSYKQWLIKKVTAFQ